MKPRDIPQEILDLIGTCLTIKDLIACVLVSRAWHAAFIGLMWSTVFLDEEDCERPSAASLNRHAPLIHTLCIRSDASTGYFDGPLFFPNLSSLAILPSTNEDYPPQLQFTVEFIRRHSATLVALEVYSALPLDLLNSCPRIQQLTTSARCTSTHAWIDCFERLWSRVQVLTIFGNWVHGPRVTLESRPAHRDETTGIMKALEERPCLIRDLEIYGCDRDMEAHLWLLTHCPNLIRLRWYATLDVRGVHSPGPAPPLQTMHYLAEAIRTRGWDCKKLEDLDLARADIQAEDLDVLLNVMNQLTKLAVCMAKFDRNSWETLQRYPRHLNSLRELIFSLEGHSAGNVQGSCLHSMLCSLPNLEVFIGGPMVDRDILADDRPWVCRGLRVLSTDIQIWSRSPRQDLIFRRLSDLHNLERCSITGSRHYREEDCLQFTMDNGLDQLSSWNRLTELKLSTIPHSSVKWGEVELHWVCQHWPKLRSIQGISTEFDKETLLPGVQFL